MKAFHFCALLICTVACRGGGANGATGQGIQGRGHAKSEIIKIRML